MLEAKPIHQEFITKLFSLASDHNDIGLLLDSARVALKFFIRSGAWDNLVLAVENGNFGELATDLSDAAKQRLGDSASRATILHVAVIELARSPELTHTPTNRLSLVSDFLHRTFISKSATSDRYGLSPKIIGAAIERVGKFVDALQYYENLEQDAESSTELKQFAMERMIQALEKYVEILKLQGKKEEVREKESRAKRLRETLGLGNKPLPDYPNLTEQETVDETKERSEWVHGPCKILLSRAHARLRIEHTQHFETITVFAKEGHLRGDANFIPFDTGDLTNAWQIPDWEMTIQSRREATRYLVTILFSGTSTEIEVPL